VYNVALFNVLISGASSGTRIAYLTSLLEITLQDNVQQVDCFIDETEILINLVA